MGPFVAQGLAASIATLTMVSAGMFFGWSAPALPKLLNPDDKDELTLTSDEASWAMSMNNFGCIFGPIIWNSFVDRIGRKWSLNLAVMPMLVSWLIIGLMTNVEALYVARFIGGLGIGAVYALLPMYLGEIAEDRIRGALGTLQNTGASVGMLVSFSIGPWISLRMFCIAAAVLLMLYLGLSAWMPETPYFLLMKGENKKAHASLAWLRGRTYVDEEIAALETNVSEQQKHRDGFGIAELFRSRGNRRAIGIIFGLFTIQQFSGVMALMYYSGLIFESSGLIGWNELSVIIIGVVQVLAGVSVIFVIDSAGRRPILMISAILSSLSLTSEAVFFHLKITGYDTSGFSWLPLLGVIIFFFAFIPGFGCIPYAMTGELFATNVKAPATMFAAIYGSAIALGVSKGYQVAGEAFGIHWVFYFFAANALLGAVFVYVFVPETKKLSLRNIQENLNSGTIRSKAHSSSELTAN